MSDMKAIYLLVPLAPLAGAILAGLFGNIHISDVGSTHAQCVHDYPAFCLLRHICPAEGDCPRKSRGHQREYHHDHFPVSAVRIVRDQLIRNFRHSRNANNRQHVNWSGWNVGQRHEYRQHFGCRFELCYPARRYRRSGSGGSRWSGRPEQLGIRHIHKSDVCHFEPQPECDFGYCRV